MERRAAGDLSVEVLDLSAKLLELNTEFYTLWNYRREILSSLLKEKGPQKMEMYFHSELKLLEKSIAMNPKSYWVWLHRKWVTSSMGTICDWKRELYLCEKLLALDERNFHCWNYRRYVSKMSNSTLEKELEFTMNQIDNNFSNYSAWHQRSAIIPVLFGKDKAIMRDVLNKEFELVQHAFYTEPSDQSAWFYYRWLMDSICESSNLMIRPLDSEQISILERQLVSIQELMTVEPNCKWPILTCIFLMMRLGKDRQIILENLVNLETIDSQHVGYYQDLSKILAVQQ